MPSADVVVVGAGLAGLTCAIRVAEAGARVTVVAAGQAALTWAAGPLDVAAPDGQATPRAGVACLAARPGHPYAILADDVVPALAWFTALAAREGLSFEGDLDRPIGRLPTALGVLRRAAIVPAGMAAGLAPWGPGERLVVVGLGGFKDLWPAAAAAGLGRAFAAAAASGLSGPAGVEALVVEVPELAARRTIDGLVLARAFDRPATRRAILGRIAAALGGRGGGRRIALPAVLGLEDHAAVLAEAAATLGVPVFELPLVPPSVPGLRLHALLRRVLLRHGGRVLLGEAVARVELDHGRVARVIVPAAAREVTITTTALVLATGGLPGGGLVAGERGRLRETVLDLAVTAPPSSAWLADDPFAAEGHPVAAAGVVTDAHLRPPDGPDGVWAAGSLLAGQRYLRERCGDGVALASAWRAAAEIAA